MSERSVAHSLGIGLLFTAGMTLLISSEVRTCPRGEVATHTHKAFEGKGLETCAVSRIDLQSASPMVSSDAGVKWTGSSFPPASPPKKEASMVYELGTWHSDHATTRPVERFDLETL